MSRIKSWAQAAAVALALTIPQAVRAADDLGYDAIRNHDWAAAERVLQEGLQANPGDTSRQLNLAWVYAQTGRKAEAAALYRDILKRDQDRVASLSSRRGQSVALLAQRGLDRLRGY